MKNPIDTESYMINMPGRVVAFDQVLQQVEVQICAERVSMNSQENLTAVDRKTLLGVPVHVASTGSYSLTLPIEIGDPCLLFFSQVGYDHWFYEDKDRAGLLAGLPKPWLHRQFNEDDGYALVGFKTQPRAISNYSIDGAELRNAAGDQVIRLLKNLDIEAETTTNIKLIAPNVEIVASTKVTLTTPELEVSGKLIVGSTIDSTGEITAGSIGLISHHHDGVNGPTSPSVV